MSKGQVLRVRVCHFTVIVISTNPNKVDFSYIDYLALAHMTNTPPRKSCSALEQLSSSFYGSHSSAFLTFTSWATRRGSYLTVLSQKTLLSSDRTPYSPRSSRSWILFRHLHLGQPNGVIT